jgi:hypothetical protein
MVLLGYIQQGSDLLDERLGEVVGFIFGIIAIWIVIRIIKKKRAK